MTVMDLVLQRVRGSVVPETRKPEGVGSLPQRIECIQKAMTARQVAEFLAISPITVYKMAKAGRLPSFRVGTAVRFDPRAIAQWLRGNLR